MDIINLDNKHTDENYSQSDKKNYIFIHTATIDSNYSYKDILKKYLQIINSSGIIDVITKIFICTVGEESDIESEIKNDKIEIISVSNNKGDYELPTLQHLYNFCLKNTNSNILYIHTKGTGKSQNVCINEWVDYMLFFLLKKYNRCLKYLEEYQTVGVDLIKDYSLHYSGNFWWARADHIITLPSPNSFNNLEEYPNSLNSLRHNQEFWICYNKQKYDNNDLHKCLHNSNIPCLSRHNSRYLLSQYNDIICIGYLVDPYRLHTFKQFVYFLNNSKYVDRIHLLLLYNNREFVNQYCKKYLMSHAKNISFSSKCVEDGHNYIKKIKFLIEYAQNNHIDYCLKIDNDLIINNYVLDYMLDNIHILNNQNNLFMTPNLSSGIPTTEFFINDFFDDEEKKSLHNTFKSTKFGEIWGYNYNFLNKYSIDSEEWDYEGYKENLKVWDGNYKGIHPIRINKESVNVLNSYILDNMHKVLENQDYKQNITSDFAYFCNSTFIIKTDKYHNIVYDKSLYVDSFDEVPVNKYCKRNNCNGIFITNSFSIHPIYNTIPNHPEMERNLFVNEKYNDSIFKDIFWTPREWENECKIIDNLRIEEDKIREERAKEIEEENRKNKEIEEDNKRNQISRKRRTIIIICIFFLFFLSLKKIY